MKSLDTPQQKLKKISPIALFSLLTAIIFCAFIISATIIDRMKVTNMELEQKILEKTHRITETITKLLYKTHILAALAVHDSGDSFDIIAPALVDDPSIRNVLIAPDGIVSKVYPLSGNESVIGLNFFSEGAGNKEAVLARELGDLVLGGPFNLIQGGQALVGRMPVYTDTSTGEQKFWGLVSVTLNFPQVLDHSELDIFDEFGYSYELWRINSDTGERQIIAGNYSDNTSSHFIERSVKILNAEWFVRISPVRMWYNYPENIVLIIAGICISFIVFFVMQNNFDMKNMQVIFEQMAISDPLTGIFNRRHFMDIMSINIEKSRRKKEDCYIIMFDIDGFKQINDTYGHQIGDKVLIEVTTRIKSHIRPYDLFARYGGEEFIIFTTDISKTDVKDMAERLRVSLCGSKYEYDRVSVNSSSSFGIAHIFDYDLDKAVKHADEALYKAKKNGRNCVVFYTDDNCQ
ncbi:MAG: sensor domain-containing diguanylate cyclase [Treponema sp.]|nr:sensor domain-containing diguanylate cyclase [Treponema sp.]